MQTFPRIYVTGDLRQVIPLTLSPDQSHYLLHVMRVKTGDGVRLFNGRDGEWLGTVAALSKRAVEIAVEKQIRPQRPEPDLWLCCAPIKKTHFDTMIEKATELGVAAIQPVLTARAQIREVNIERCRAIAVEASEQSERLNVPDIRKPLTLPELIAKWPADRALIVCAEWGEAIPVQEAFNSPPLAAGVRGGGATPGATFQNENKAQVMLNASLPNPSREGEGNRAAHAAAKVAIITGPEGGFAAGEFDQLRQIPHAVFIRLGPRILRADTAAIAVLSCWQAWCGDWSQRAENGCQGTETVIE